MSGYDLTKRFAVSLAHAWPAQLSQIYAELARLLHVHWICQTGNSPRGRKVYQSTSEGVAALREWLTDTEADPTLRHDPTLRAFFRWTPLGEKWWPRGQPVDSRPRPEATERFSSASFAAGK